MRGGEGREEEGEREREREEEHTDGVLVMRASHAREYERIKWSYKRLINVCIFCSQGSRDSGSKEPHESNLLIQMETHAL